MSGASNWFLLTLSLSSLILLDVESALGQNVPTGVEQVPPISVIGQETSASPSRPDLQPDNTANFARVAPSSRPHTETFTRADIEAIRPADIYDLLSHAAGVVVTYQGRKLGYNLMIRGDSNYGFIIDGAYVPLATAGRILQTLPISAIEQVDIVRDSTALMLGPLVDFDSASGALNSGFIVIRTRQPTKTEGELRSSVASFGSTTASGYAGTVFADGPVWSKAYVSGLIAHAQTAGPTGYNSWGTSTTGFLKTGATAGIFETSLEVFHDDARYGFERALAGQSTSSLVAQQWSYAPIDTTLITSNSNIRWNANNSTLLTFSYNTVSAQNVQASYSSSAVTFNEDKSYTFSANLRHSLQFEQTLLQAGVEYVGYDSPTGQLFYAGYANAEETLSGYVHGEQKLFADRLTLDASARVDDHTIIQGIDLYNQGNGGGSGKAVYQYFYNRTLPLAMSFSGGAAWTILPQLMATGRFSHTAQSGLTNLLSANGEALQPESQNKWELGLLAPLSEAFRPGLNVFDIKIDNDKTPTSYEKINGYQTPLWSETNTERRGFELIGKGLVADNLLGRTNYSASWMHLTNVTSSTIATYPSTIARNVVNGTLTQTWREYSGTAALTYVSPYWSNFNSSDGLYHSIGNFVVVDLRVGRSFDLGATKANLSVFGRNITDRKYETVYGFPAWGSVYGSEFTLTF
jgi:outer membrane cobalamin receptor